MWGYVKLDLKEMVYQGSDEGWDRLGDVMNPQNESSVCKLKGISWVGQELLTFEARLC